METLRMSPIQRDAIVFLGGLALVLVTVAVAVPFGVSFGPEPGIAPWAIVLTLGAVLVFAASVVWWYYVHPDEREPARGEFTVDPEHHIREGHGSFRTKALAAGSREEPEARMAEEPGFVPRTRMRWVAWFVLMGVALVAFGLLARAARTSDDPLTWMLVAVGLLGGAVMLGAVGVGEFSHQGPWARRGERGAR